MNIAKNEEKYGKPHIQKQKAREFFAFLLV